MDKESIAEEYKGDLFKGKRHGKGKLYNYGILVFEGEFFNGERHGKGKEYNYINGGLIFDGEYLNGKRSGKVSFTTPFSI